MGCNSEWSQMTLTMHAKFVVKLNLQVYPCSPAKYLKISLDEQLKPIVEGLKAHYPVGSCPEHPAIRCSWTSSTEASWHIHLDARRLNVWANSIVRDKKTQQCSADTYAYNISLRRKLVMISSLPEKLSSSQRIGCLLLALIAQPSASRFLLLCLMWSSQQHQQLLVDIFQGTHGQCLLLLRFILSRLHQPHIQAMVMDRLLPMAAQLLVHGHTLSSRKHRPLLRLDILLVSTSKFIHKSKLLRCQRLVVLRLIRLLVSMPGAKSIA